MRAVDELLAARDRRDETTNVEIAIALAEHGDRAQIAEVVALLASRDQDLRSDSIKVLYEIGERNPELISDYAPQFLDLLDDRQNRIVWGAMSALAAITPLAADELEADVPAIEAAMATGSVITVDMGVRVLAGIAASSDERRERIFPILLEHLRMCRAKEIPQHSEQILSAVTVKNRGSFVELLESRLPENSPAQAKRIQRVIARAAALPSG